MEQPKFEIGSTVCPKKGLPGTKLRWKIIGITNRGGFYTYQLKHEGHPRHKYLRESEITRY